MSKTLIYITPGCFDKGGISRYSRYQIESLRKLYGKDQVYVMSLMGPESDSFEEDFRVDYAGKSIHRWEQVRFAWHFIKMCLILRPRIIHSAHVNLSGLAHVLSLLTGAVTVLNVYGLEVWSGLSYDALWGLKNTCHIISDCHNTKNYLVSHNIRKEKDIDVIWDCIDLSKFRPQTEEKIQDVARKYNLPPFRSSKVILTLGRLSRAARHKGYHRLLEAFNRLKDPQCILVFCGKGDLVEELKSVAETKGLASSVFFTGMIHEDDMAAIYSYPNLFSLISEVGHGMGEGIPLTPLEAMACGAPIVVGDQDGSKEAIFDSQANGYALDPQDIDLHVSVYQRLLQLSEHRAEMSGAAISIAEKYFSEEVFLAKHKTFLTEKALL